MVLAKVPWLSSVFYIYADAFDHRLMPTRKFLLSQFLHVEKDVSVYPAAALVKENMSVQGFEGCPTVGLSHSARGSTVTLALNWYLTGFHPLLPSLRLSSGSLAIDINSESKRRGPSFTYERSVLVKLVCCSSLLHQLGTPRKTTIGAVQSRRRECGLVNKRLVLVFLYFKLYFDIFHIPGVWWTGSAETRRPDMALPIIVRDKTMSRRAW